MPRDHAHGEGEIVLDDFVTDESTGLEEYEFSDEVKRHLKKMGISEDTLQQPMLEEEHQGMFPDLQPGEYFDGRMPNVLKRLTLDQLSALSGLMNNWHQYMVSRRSLAAVEKSEATRQRKFILSLVRNQYKDSGSATSDKEAEEKANLDFRFITADKALAKSEIIYKTLDDHVALAKSNQNVLSRELSNIRTKLEQDAIGGVGGGSRPPQRFQHWRRDEENGDGEHQEEEATETPPKRSGKKGPAFRQPGRPKVKTR